MTELISESIVELSTRGSLLQAPILLYSFPSHSLESIIQNIPYQLTLWCCVAV